MDGTKFFDEIAEILADIRTQPETIYRDDCKLIYVESHRTMVELNNLLRKYQNANRKLDEKGLQALRQLLVDRWEKIKNTNAAYIQNPDSHANIICTEIAEMLAPLLHIHPLQLLMPTLEQKDLEDIDLRRVVLSDDNKYFIDVLASLERAQQEKTPVLKHTHPDRKDVPLSAAEMNRVTHFTSRTLRYYQEIVSQRSLTAIQRAYRRCKNLLGYTQVRAWYPETDKLLTKTIFANFKAFSRADLANTLIKYPLEFWPKIYSNIKPQALEKIVLKGRDIGEAAADKTNYLANNENYNRAGLFLFIDLYRKTRKEKPPFTSMWGEWTGYADEKNEKLQESDEPYQFLLSGKPLKEFKAPVGGPGSRGHLGIITKQIEKVAQPDFFEEPAVRTFLSRWLR